MSPCIPSRKEAFQVVQNDECPGIAQEREQKAYALLEAGIEKLDLALDAMVGRRAGRGQPQRQELH